MESCNGTIVFQRRSAKGLWYTLFSPDTGKIDLFSRKEHFLLFDRVEATLERRTDSCFLADWDIVERSPLAMRPEHLSTAGYFACLIACFTEAGLRERSFVEAARTILNDPLDRDRLAAAERLWGHAMGLHADTPETIDHLIRDHSIDGYRIRHHLLTLLAHRENRYA